MDWWTEPLRSVVAGRRVILAGGVVPSWAPTVAAVRAAGAAELMIVATEGRGVGPAPDDVPCWVAEREAGGTMAVLRRAEALLREPPDDLVAALGAFDPDRSALVIGGFLSESPALDGRPLLAHRRPEWLALEDKVVADALWDRAGVARRPSTVVPAAAAAGSWRQFDEGNGTVWAADAREGFHGGASLIRWVTDEGAAAAATAALAPHCDTIRIMPFVEGIPCSVHGIVLPDGVLALRPVEMVTLRRGHELVYAGCSTFYDPPSWIREAMRSAARAVGALLRAEVGFRGTFTIDGVAAADGFWPTELNPRFGAGLATVARGMGTVPLTLVNDLVVAGVPLGRSASDWEPELLAAADAQRSGGTWKASDAAVPAEIARSLVHDGAGWRDAGDDEAPHAVVSSTPTFVRATFRPEATPVGPSVAGRAAAFWEWAARELAAGPAGLSAARDVHRVGAP